MAAFPPTAFRLVAVSRPRSVLYERIERRLDAQLAAGFVDEARALAGRPGGLSRTARQALGYRELLAHVAGEVTLDAAVAETVRRTRAFARRQLAWFRRDPRIAWLEGQTPMDVLPALEDWMQCSSPSTTAGATTSWS